jgi:fructose 1,6-bisphosphatase
MFLTLPNLSKVDCGSGDGHKWIFDDVASPGTDSFCQTFADAAITKAATPKCFDCIQIWMSGQTSVASVLVHGLVFGVLVYFISQRL